MMARWVWLFGEDEELCRFVVAVVSPFGTVDGGCV